MITANKGEWSELYALFKILGEKKIYAGDGKLNKLDTFYPVIAVIRDELQRHLEYALDSTIVVLSEDGGEFNRIKSSVFLEKAGNLFSAIKNHKKDDKIKGGAFEIPSLADFMEEIHCQRVKAKSQNKADIYIVIHDYHTGMQPKLGFSIKSDAGGRPALLNASNATVFEYKLTGRKVEHDFMLKVNAISGKRKIQNRVAEIYKAGSRLEFANVSSPIFLNNMKMISDSLPEIIAWLMADSYRNRDMSVLHSVERMRTANPKGYDLSFGHDFYGYKIKSLMVATALGMLPNKTWTGLYEATGGYIIVKKDGDIICFHIYDRSMLEEYLFRNTKFETPTSNRYNLGRVYQKEDDNYYFNLVMQIRFI